MFSVLKNRDFFWLWLGQTVSQVGDGIRDYALIFWIFNTSGHSPVIQSFSLIVTILPQVVLGPMAGVWVDRWDRRRTMVVSDVIRGFLSLGLVLAALSGQYWIALALNFAASSVAQFFGPARGAMIPRVIPRDQLVQANALSQTTYALLQVMGPALGTAVFLSLGERSSFALDAVSFFISAGCILLVATARQVAHIPSRRPDFLAEMKSGLDFIVKSGPIRASGIALITMMLGSGAINSIEIFLVRLSLNLPESTYAQLASVSALAMLAAAAVVGSMAKKLKRVPLLVPLGLGLGFVGIAAITAAPSVGWLYGASVVVGVCNAVLNIGISTIFQTFVPDELRGRVQGVGAAIPVSGMVLSAALAGYLAQTINVRYIFGGADVFLALGAVVAYRGLRSVVIPAPAEGAASAV